MKFRKKLLLKSNKSLTTKLTSQEKALAKISEEKKTLEETNNGLSTDLTEVKREMRETFRQKCEELAQLKVRSELRSKRKLEYPEESGKKCKSASKSCGDSPMIVLSSPGPAAEFQPNCLGKFVNICQHNNAPAYRSCSSQAEAVGSYFLYKLDSGRWGVGSLLGGSEVGLRSSRKTESVPRDKWFYYDGAWCPDPAVTSLPVSDQ